MIDQINEQLKRLKVSEEDNFASGLISETYVNDEDEEIEGFVIISDDQANGTGTYDTLKLLKILQRLTQSSLQTDSPINIWEQISNAAVD